MTASSSTSSVSQLSPRDYALIALAMIAFQVAVLYTLGRVPICTCGTVKLWQGVVTSAENSQHIFDWYTPSHVIHGILLYAVLRFVFPNMPVLQRFLLALGIEIVWEIIENTPFVIERYRNGTADVATATGDDSDFTREFLCHGYPRSANTKAKCLADSHPTGHVDGMGRR